MKKRQKKRTIRYPSDLNVFDREDRVKIMKKRYPNWTIVGVENGRDRKIHAARETGEVLTDAWTIPGCNGIEKQIKMINEEYNVHP